MSLQVDGLGLLADQLAGLEARATDLHPAFELIVEDVHRIEGEQFASEGARGGTPWAPLAPSTVAARGGRAHPIEQHTGDLIRSLTGDGGIGAFRELTGTGLGFSVGTKLPYAAFQQTGTRRMPARPLVALTTADEVRWAEIITRYLVP